MSRGRKSNPPSLQELHFQDAFERWEQSGYTDKKAWDDMFFRVHECCNALASVFCTGIYNPMFEGRVMDATIYFMNRIKKEHIRPTKLSSWCYLGVKGYIFGQKQQREDRELCYDERFDGAVDILGNPIDMYDYNDYKDEVKGICREELMTTED